MRCKHLIAHYSALTRKEILIHATKRTTIEDIKLNKQVTKEQILYNPTYMKEPTRVKFIETGREMCAGGWSMGSWEVLFNEHRVSVWGDEEVL